MDIKFTILLFSKYSENSKRFIDVFKEKIPENIVSSLKFNSICIDNDKIRKSILNSKQISVKAVPCILTVYTDGGAEKFEGPDAFTWLEDIITKINIDIEKEQQILYEKNLIEQEKEQIMLEKRKIEEERLAVQMMNNEFENLKKQYQEQYEEQYEEEYEEEEMPPPPPPPKKKKAPEKQKIKKLPLKSKVSSQSKKTSISDLQSENEDEAEENLEEIFDAYEEGEEDEEKEKTKDALSLKKESLMSAAMAMQKSRESQDSDIKKPIMMNR
jgi:hypothetical protein